MTTKQTIKTNTLCTLLIIKTQLPLESLTPGFVTPSYFPFNMGDNTSFFGKERNRQ